MMPTLYILDGKGLWHIADEGLVFGTVRCGLIQGRRFVATASGRPWVAVGEASGEVCLLCKDGKRDEVFEPKGTP